MTNSHIIFDPEEARRYLAEFDYELDEKNRIRAVTRFELNPDEFFASSDFDELDFDYFV